MNLISCRGCGVVLDLDHIVFLPMFDHESQELIEENVEWDGDDYVTVSRCPVCNTNIQNR